MKDKTRISIDYIFQAILQIIGYLVLRSLGGLFAMLIYTSISLFTNSSPLDFITGMEWAPTAKDPKYGMLPLILSTTIVTFGAMAIAIPLGIGTAAFIAEYASPRLKNILK